MNVRYRVELSQAERGELTTIEYACGKCATVLLLAEEGQIRSFAAR
jgi:hypothetical protein